MKKSTEYDVREINQFGDAVNVDHFNSPEKAEKAARDLIARLPEQYPDPDDEETVVAVVVEKHSMMHQSDGRMVRSDYVTLLVGGSNPALVAGGWVR